MERKTVLNALLLFSSVSILVVAAFSYYDLYSRLTGLESDYNSLLDEHQLLQTSHEELESDFESLDAAYANFSSDYNQLNESYQALAIDYAALKQSLTELSVVNGSIFSNYSMLLEVFNAPLAYENVPSVEELELWLAADKTDEIEYTEPNFICGDFATMLSQHAKMNNWDMGVIAVFGRTTDRDDFAHAINAIVCEEGLVYVEPQTDEVWWIRNHKEIPENAWSYFPDVGSVFVEQHSVIVWYS